MIKEKITSYLNKFFNSLYLPLFLSLFTVFTWKTNSHLLMLSINAILAIGIIHFKANKLNFVLTIFSFISGDRNVDKNFASFFGVITLILTIAAIAYVIYDLFKNYKIKFRHPVIYAFCIFLMCALLSLINTPIFSTSILAVGKFSLALLFAIYIFNTVKYNDDNKSYLSKLMMFISLIIIMQMGIKYFEIYDPENMFYVIKAKQLHLGWNLSNRYVCYLVIALISTTYFYITSESTKKKIIIALILFVQLMAILLCMSRGAYLAIAVTALPLLGVLFFYSKNRKKELYMLLIVGLILLGAILLLTTIEVFSDLFEGFLETDYSDDRGRTPLYDLAYERFKANWLIGDGIASSKYYITSELGYELSHYHNIVLELLAEQGVIGFLSFSAFIGISVFYSLKKDIYKSLFICIAIYLLAHGMVDTTFHSHSLMYIYMLILGFTVLNKKENKEIENIV